MNKTPDALHTADPYQVDGMTRFDQTMQMLRGRWGLVAILALIGMIGGGFVGYKVPTPVYRSEGLIEIKPVVPKILISDDTKDLRAQFEGYVRQQLTLLNSKEVLKTAMLDPDWQAIAPGTGDGNFIHFERSADAEREVRSQVINVYFSDSNPAAALVGVKVITNAYMKLAQAKEEEDKAQVYDIVVAERDRVERELEQARQEITDATNEVGADSLEKMYSNKLVRLVKLEEELDQVKMTLIAMHELVGSASRSSTLQLIASSDTQLRTLLRDRYLVQREISRLSADYGSEHGLIRQQKTVLANLNEMVELYVDEARGEGPVAGGGAEALRLRAQEYGLEAIIKRVNKEAAIIGRKELRLSQLRDQETRMEDKIKLIRERLDDLTITAAASGRIKILSDGTVPASPYSDRRNLGSVMGVALGGMFGFGIVLFIAWLDPSIRNLDDLELTVSDIGRLGVLPQLPDDLTDVEAITTAAHCVHNIRTKMQISTSRDNNHVFAITSAGPATGKSSLAMALGLSFAGTGGKTLLVDCDLIGSGLSRRVDDIVSAQSKHPLVRAELVTEAQLNRARVKAQEENRFLVEVLVETGDLLSRDAQRASSLLDDSNKGLLDVLDGSPLADCVLETKIPSLHVLAVGSATEHDISRLSLSGLQRVFEAAREQYDTIIVDTGPIPGSAEASLVTAVADGTVLVVTRGEDRMEIKRASDELRRNRVPVLGIVYNRADDMDMELSGATSVSRRSIRPEAPASLMVDSAALSNSKIGGLGISVAIDSRQDLTKS